MGGIGGGVGGWVQGPAAAATPTGYVTPEGINYGAGVSAQSPTVANMNSAVTGTSASTFSPMGAAPSGITGATTSGTQVGLNTATQVATQQPQTFMQALRQVPSNIAQRFQDPTALADLTLRAAGMLAGSYIAGDGLSPQEQRLLAAQQEELQWLRENNETEFRRRLQEAERLLGQSRYFDPEYFGMQAATRQQLAGSIAEREGLRGMSGDRRAAEQRRFRLGTARNTGTAYDVGYQQGVQGQINLTQAGLNALPRPSDYSAMGNYGPLMSAYGSAADRARQQQSDIGSFFGSLVSTPPRQEEEEEMPRVGGLYGGGV